MLDLDDTLLQALPSRTARTSQALLDDTTTVEMDTPKWIRELQRQVPCFGLTARTRNVHVGNGLSTMTMEDFTGAQLRRMGIDLSLHLPEGLRQPYRQAPHGVIFCGSGLPKSWMLKRLHSDCHFDHLVMVDDNIEQLKGLCTAHPQPPFPCTLVHYLTPDIRIRKVSSGWRSSVLSDQGDMVTALIDQHWFGRHCSEPSRSEPI